MHVIDLRVEVTDTRVATVIRVQHLPMEFHPQGALTAASNLDEIEVLVARLQDVHAFAERISNGID